MVEDDNVDEVEKNAEQLELIEIGLVILNTFVKDNDDDFVWNTLRDASDLIDDERIR